MKNLELTKQLQRIDDLIKSTSSYTGGNIELQGHWGKYLCILAAGFLENAISEVYISFVDKASSRPVATFASDTLKKIQNPKATKFVEIASSFKKEWGDEIEDLFKKDQGIKNAIDSIMTNRHLIAHGKNTTISIVRVKEYLYKSIELIDFLEKLICDRQK